MRAIHRRSARLTAAALLAAAGLVACGGGGDDDGDAAPTSPSTTAAASAGSLGDRVQRFLVSGNTHVAGRVQYAQTPPVGGDHNGTWQNCGFYREPILPELAVHSLEHGAVWIVFRPALPADQVDVLRRLASRPYLLVSPWADDGTPAPVVASAWGLQLKADTAADPAVGAFVQAYANGPQSPEPGAPCTGAFGDPE